MRFAPYPLTLRQLQYVLAVSEERSFRRAAERCRVAQPSLSTQLAEAERALGVTLFERSRRGVVLTPAGEALIPRVRAVLLATDELLLGAGEHTDPLAGTLRIGVIPTVAPYLLPRLDPVLRDAFPRLDLRWREEKTGVLAAAVEAGELDAALLALEADIGALETEAVLLDPFVLAAAPDHPLARGRAPLDLSRLSGHAVMLLDDGHCFRDQALDLCARVRAGEDGFRATSLSTLVQVVAGSGGVTLLPSVAVPLENRDGRLVVRRFRGKPPRRTLVLGWRRRSALADSLRRLAREGRRALAAGQRRRAR